MIKFRNTDIEATAIFLAVAFMLFLNSCGNDDSQFSEAQGKRASQPMLNADSVTTLISDSGITRFRITTKKWLVFDKAKEPYWFFPQGIRFEKFDSTYHVDANMWADTAIYYTPRELWEFKGHVTATNLDGDKFKTQQLFWDNPGQKFYSNKHIRIEQKDKILEGIGFVSNNRMTQYEISKPTGIFPVE